jgi:hypothetical protein
MLFLQMVCLTKELALRYLDKSGMGVHAFINEGADAGGCIKKEVGGVLGTFRVRH